MLSKSIPSDCSIPSSSKLLLNFYHNFKDANLIMSLRSLMLFCRSSDSSKLCSNIFSWLWNLCYIYIISFDLFCNPLSAFSWHFHFISVLLEKLYCAYLLMCLCAWPYIQTGNLEEQTIKLKIVKEPKYLC